MSDSESVAMDRPLQFALFGAGRMGLVHFRDLILSEHAVPVWVVDDIEDRAKALVRRYRMSDRTRTAGTVRTNDIINDPSVDAIMVCTPSFTHEPIVRAALQAGKPVFCEKPLAPSLQVTEELYELAASKEIPLFCAFNRRYDPQLRKLHDDLRAGSVGSIRYLTQVSRDPAAMMTREYLETSGGILVDSVVHDIDTALWLMGEMPKTVYCVGQVTHQMYAECNDVDVCVLTMTFPGGAICTINMCREANFGNDQRIEVVGSKGMLQTDNQRPLEFRKWTPEGTTEAPIYVQGIERYRESYRLELEHFIDVLQGKTKPEITQKSTCAVLKIVELAKLSMKDGQVQMC